MRSSILVLLFCFLIQLAGCADEEVGPIVGRWESVPDSNETLGYRHVYDFASNGDLTITLQHPILSDTSFQASYELQWDSVLTITDGFETDQVIATIVNDTLVFRSVEGTTRRHVRIGL